MINSLQGTIKVILPMAVVLETGGIGFLVTVTGSENYIVGETAQLFIEFYWNAEQGPSLFGFKTAQEKSIFSLVIGCSGFGPKIAIAVLNTLSPSLFIDAIATNDIKTLSSISGVGSKKAETMILQLKDKVQKLVSQGLVANDSPTAALIKKVSDVLTSLHYERSEIFQALEHIRKIMTTTTQTHSFDETLRNALLFLSKAGKRP